LSWQDFTIRRLDSEFHIDLRIQRTGEGREVRLPRVIASTDFIRAQSGFEHSVVVVADRKQIK
jgi:hypothetical protein